MDGALNTLLLVGGNAALAALAYGLTKLTNWISSKVKNETIKGVITRLDDAAMIAVKAEYQKHVRSLKAGEQFTVTMQRESQGRAKDSVQASLGQKGLKDLSKIVGQDRLAVTIQKHVEAAVHDAKQLGKAAQK